MRRAISVRPAGTWPESSAVGSVTLPWEDRHRRRIRLVDDTGRAFLLDLERAMALTAGDGLVLEDGGIVCVKAAREAVIEVGCRTAAEAARIAWHLGNRHTPVQVLPDGALRLAADHVLADMLRRLGVDPVAGEAPFEPEPGAYANHGGDERDS